MAISTFNSKLMYKDGAEWKQVCPIKGIPQIGGEPEQLETTTNDDKIQTFIDGIQQQETMSVTANFETEIMDTIDSLSGEQDLSFWLGMAGTGDVSKFSGKGKIAYYVNSADVNSVVELTIVITPSKEFERE